MERTFIIIKPDGVKRRLVGEIITRFEKKGLYIVQMKVMKATEELLKKHYSMHTNKSFFPKIIKAMTSGDIISIILEGENAVKIARTIIGATNPLDADPSSIRGEYCLSVDRNLVHGSDSVESAMKEIKIWLGDMEDAKISYFDKDILYE